VNFGIDSYFSAWSCGDESFGKPHPEVMHSLLEACGVAPHETLMIGDTEADMLLAKNANTDALAVSYGLQPVSVLLQCGAEGAIYNISELPAYLRASSARE
jgi:phosphoglycolate phosphatase